MIQKYSIKVFSKITFGSAHRMKINNTLLFYCTSLLLFSDVVEIELMLVHDHVSCCSMCGDLNLHTNSIEME